MVDERKWRRLKKFWNFKSLTDAESELRIEGEIVSDDDSWIYEWLGIPHSAPSSFRKSLSEHKGKNLTVWVDSWGGDVFAGVGIHNALKEHKGEITVKVDGKAVSAGSIIAMAGDKILMSPGSVMMIHNVWGFISGEAKDMRKTADIYDEIKQGLINIYQARTTVQRNDISKMMDDETWMNAQTAINLGFADGMLYAQVTEEEQVQTAYSFSRLAIQNSVKNTMTRFFEQWQKINGSEEIYRASSGPAFNVGDRIQVAIDTPHMEGQSTGEVREAVLTYTYGVVFDGMEDMGIHKWYIESELQAESTDGTGKSVV